MPSLSDLARKGRDALGAVYKFNDRTTREAAGIVIKAGEFPDKFREGEELSPLR